MKKYISIISGILIIVAASFYYAPKVRAGYTYSRTIQTTAASIPVTQTNFTILVCANGSSPCNASVPGLNQSGGGAHVQNSNGYDIVFSTASDCSSALLSWEMEKYVAATGEMEAWVLIPSLTSSTNQIYMCYGNSAISSFQGGSTGAAWDSSYKGVWHLPDGSSLTANDSTSNGYNGTVTGATATTGQIDGAASFSSGNVIDISTFSNFSYPITLDIWSNATVNQGTFVQASSFNTNMLFYINGTAPSLFVSGGNEVNGHAGDIDGTLKHIVVSVTSGGVAQIYVNGATSGGTATLTSLNTTTALKFFNGYTANTGKLDEVRISNTNRSANWITTEYNNESAPGSFITFGSESTNGGGPVTLAGEVTINGANGAVQINGSGTKIIGN